ncbi:histidine kinase dimerization/phosphoacceptor domain-containing protein, partial [Streptomyces sp. SP17KL33]|nr:histidine kinase dimerization/phosphoacceptor domain-containing protein [Streptomyces sp. SP17KL33]
IARDLHDLLAHSITLVGVQTSVAAHVLAADPDLFVAIDPVTSLHHVPPPETRWDTHHDTLHDAYQAPTDAVHAPRSPPGPPPHGHYRGRPGGGGGGGGAGGGG